MFPTAHSEAHSASERLKANGAVRASFQAFQNVVHSARELLTPTLKSTQFLDKGQLTPEEFVIAGDALTRIAPSWVWSGGEPRLAKSYLPTDKQFLVTRNVVCRRRVAEIAASADAVERDEGGGWTSAGGLASAVIDEEYADLASAEPGPLKKLPASPASEPDDDDLAAFMDAHLMTVHDASTAVIPLSRDHGERSYTLYIVYDNVYRTPRVYLMGFNPRCGIPLKPEAMLEDLMQDYVSKTATLEKHPHLANSQGQYVSIHPCRHAQTMKRLIDEMPTTPSIELYLLIFLKFISSVIPTIEYDMTSSVAVGKN